MSSDHHWKGEVPDPSKYVGFIYLIVNETNGRKYIGKKFYEFTVRKIVPGRKNRKIVKKPSKWEFYTGSCEYLNEDIKELGKDKFSFIILKQCTSKGMLSYAENEEIFLRGALLTDAYYNRQTHPIKFVPRGVCE